jgi:hypothetical protein
MDGYKSVLILYSAPIVWVITLTFCSRSFWRWFLKSNEWQKVLKPQKSGLSFIILQCYIPVSVCVHDSITSKYFPCITDGHLNSSIRLTVRNDALKFTKFVELLQCKISYCPYTYISYCFTLIQDLFLKMCLYS